MTYDDLIAHYGTQAQAAAALGIDRQVVHGWSKRNSVPLDSQLQYEVATAGTLRADISDEMRAVLGKQVAA
jgi:hypothetical protein